MKAKKPELNFIIETKANDTEKEVEGRPIRSERFEGSDTSLTLPSEMSGKTLILECKNCQYRIKEGCPMPVEDKMCPHCEEWNTLEVIDFMSDAQSVNRVAKKLYLVWCYVTNGIIEPTGEQTEITSEELELLKQVAIWGSKYPNFGIKKRLKLKALLKKLSLPEKDHDR